MLKELRIRNLALIEKAEISFSPGLAVITGETGAGKSVFLTALRLLGGEKFSKQSLRRGESEAKIEGIFDATSLDRTKALLDEAGIELLDGEIAIERTLSANGKSRNRINGTIVNQTVLQKIGESLLQSHGQSEQLLLRDVRTHGELIDLYGGHTAQLTDYRNALAAQRNATEELLSLRKRQQELAEQEEFLRFQYEELERAKLREGEEEELTAKLQQTSSQGEQICLAEEAIEQLHYGEHSLSNALHQLSKTVERLAALLPEFQNYVTPLIEAKIQLQELEGELSRKGDREEKLSEQELDRLNGRLALLQRLQRKYRTDLPGLILLHSRRAEELSRLTNFEIDLADAQNKLSQAGEKLRAAALALHHNRATAAEGLHRQVEAELQQLGMAGARFTTHFSPMDQELNYSSDGADHPEFFASINPGEGERPLRNTLSGGELSRLMLALKTTLAENDTTPVLLFDEVEAGISGETGHQVGDRLSALGRHHQVMTVSHLHQVAARADQHYLISKQVEEGRTRTSITRLDHPGRTEELARMLGAPHDRQTKTHAQSLLDQLSPKR